MSNKLNRANMNGNDIIIDDGSKTYNIKNRKGKVLSVFTFRPSDTNITKRYEEVKEFFEGYQKEEEVSAEEVEREFVEKMDYLIGGDTKEAFFSILGAFSPMPDGRLFIEVCMDAICNVISKEFNVRMEKTRSRMNKYTQKYHG